MTTTTTRRRGRPALAWLAAEDLRALPTGTPVAIETRGKHTSRLLGRITGHRADGTIQLATPRGEVDVTPHAVRRGRVVEGLYEPGDPVLRRDLSVSIWRGGVVRVSGTEVLVEQIDGSFAWFPESDLEPADARDAAPPAQRRGPVPTQLR